MPFDLSRLFRFFRRQSQVNTWRTVAWDSLEDRLALSAQPVAAFACSIAPIAPPEMHVASPSPLADTHDASGVTYAHDEFGFYGSGQTVAVIDSGIWYQHVALGGGLGANYRVVGGWDFTGAGDANPRDDGPAGFHGTHVAGIIGADDAEHPGVAPEVDLVALRVFDNQGNADWGWVEAALDWVHANRNAFENPITTVNLSLGADLNTANPPNWAMLEDEFAQLEADGLFISVSAGNAFQDYLAPGLSYPASSPFVVPVMSVDENGQLSDFSQRHSRAIAAPGENIVSTVPDYVFGADGVHNDFGAASGTSMAAPYLAGASVLLREALWFTGDFSVTQDDLYGLMRDTADQIYDSVTGAWYGRLNVRSALDQIMVGAGLEGAVEWGAVEQLHVGNQALDSSQVFEFQATRDGLFTVEAFFAHAGGDVNLTIRDTAGNVLGGASGQSNVERLDIQVIAGQTYRLQTSGANSDVDFRLTNLAAIANGEVAVFGTSGDDAFTFSAGASLEATVNGVRYSFDRSDVQSVTFSGGDGSDVIDATGSAGVDRATLRAGRFSMTGDGYTASGQSLETVRLLAGAGNDVATFHDSTAADRMVSRPGATSMRSAGYFNSARGFECVTAYSTAGGADSAYLYDSAGNDTFIGRPESSAIRGAGFENAAVGFRRVYALGEAGGADTAQLYDSLGDETLVASPRQIEWSGADFRIAVSGFARTSTYATGGADRATLFGSSTRDRFSGGPATTMLVGSGYWNSANGFDRVDVRGMGGADSAELNDSAGNDRLTALPNHVQLTGPGFTIIVRDFRETAAFSTAGGADQATLYGDSGDDLFEGSVFWGRMTSGGSENTVSGFGRISSRAGAGGADRAVFHEIGQTDLLYGRDNLALLYAHGFRGYSYDFDDVTAHARPGETANADVSAVDYLFDRVGDWD